MFLTEEKLSQRIEEIRQYRYREVQKIPGFQVKEDVTGLVKDGMCCRQVIAGAQGIVTCGCIQGYTFRNNGTVRER